MKRDQGGPYGDLAGLGALTKGDRILAMDRLYQKDRRPGSVNAALGILYNERGDLFVPSAVIEAAKRVTPYPTHAYLNASGPVDWGGHFRLVKETAKLVFGDLANDLLAQNHIGATSTVGGTQAVRLQFDALAAADQKDMSKAVLVGDPAYANHGAIINAAGLIVESYPQVDSNGFNVEGLMDRMVTSKKRPILLLQGNAHNPTGIGPTLSEFKIIAEEAARVGAFVFFDMPYAGLKDSVTKDFAPIEVFVRQGVHVSVAASFSKNGGEYGERVGSLLTVCSTEDYARGVSNMYSALMRPTISSPPAHGAEVMATLLEDPVLKAQWMEQDLPPMAGALLVRRKLLAEALPPIVGDRIKNGSGLFCTVPIPLEGANDMMDKHAVYTVGMKDYTRINLGGVPTAQISQLGIALNEALQEYRPNLFAAKKT